MITKEEFFKLEGINDNKVSLCHSWAVSEKKK